MKILLSLLLFVAFFITIICIASTTVFASSRKSTTEKDHDDTPTLDTIASAKRKAAIYNPLFSFQQQMMNQNEDQNNKNNNNMRQLIGNMDNFKSLYSHNYDQLIFGNSSTDPGLPCFLNHGCWCDHKLPHLNIQDGQYYGTCILCDKGWTGWNCNSLMSPCLNNGVETPPGSKHCVCQPGFSGSSCQDIYCLNAEGGTGPYSAAPVSPYTNQCDKKCKDGWGGMQCQLCDTNAACAAKKPGDVCWKDMASVSHSINWECNLTGILEYFMTENPFPFVIGNIQCVKPTSFVPNPQTKIEYTDGNCSLAVYRSDKSLNPPPGHPQPPPDTPRDSPLWTRWLDAFMYCTMERCIQEVYITTTEAVFGPPPAYAETLRKAFTYTTFGISGILVLLHALAPTKVTAKYGPFLVLLIGAFVLITILVTVFAGLAHRPLITPSNRTEIVEVTCAETTCKCSDVGLEYGISCKKYKVHDILEQLTGQTKIRCDRYAKSCKVLQSSLSYLTIDLVTCQAAQCVNPSDIPSTDKNTPSPDAAQNNQDNSGDKELFGADGDKNRIFMIWGTAGVAILIVVVIFIHLVYYFYWHVPMMEAEWNSLVKLDILATDEENNNNNENNNNIGDITNNNVKNGDDDVPIPGETTSLLSKVDDDDNEFNTDDNKYHDEVVSARGGGSSYRVKRKTVYNSTTLKLKGATYDIPQAAFTRFLKSMSSSSTTATAKEEKQKQQQKPTRTRVLHGVDFDLNGGRSLAVLGGSGAGKTTLLNILAAQKVDGVVGGQLAINNNVLDLGDAQTVTASVYRSMIGFVHQDDRLIEYLTVKQCIFHAARMRLPLPINNDEVTALVDEVISELGLTTCQDTVVGGKTLRGVSGGERRRVSIACELVGYPRILLLDEPTSGLDALSARKVMQLVLRLPHRPLESLQKFGGNLFNFKPIIIFTIHQPSADIYQMFDQVLVLVSGRKVVFGAARDALEDGLTRCNLSISEAIDSMMNNNNKTNNSGKNKNNKSKKYDENNDTVAAKSNQNNNTTNTTPTPYADDGQNETTRNNNNQSPTSTTRANYNLKKGHGNNNHHRYTSSFEVLSANVNNLKNNKQTHRQRDQNKSIESAITAADSSIRGRTPNYSPLMIDRDGSIDYINNNNTNANDDEDDTNASLLHQQQLQQQMTSYVNPAELLLQVALKLYELMYSNNDDNKDAPSNNNNNNDSERVFPIRAEQQQQNEEPLLDPESPTTILLARSLSQGGGDNIRNKKSGVGGGINTSQNIRANTQDDDNDARHSDAGNDAVDAANANNVAIATQQAKLLQDDPINQKATVANLSSMMLLHRFEPGFWHQLQFLFNRSLDSFTGMFTLTALHIFAGTFLSLLFSFLYRHEKLDLPGTEDKAGMLTFLLLVVAFSSISCLELLVSEGRVFASDYDRGLYGVTPYFLVKILFDFIPHRIVPTAMLAISTYFPMGLRSDGDGIHFVMFTVILIIFSIWNVALCISIGLVANDFGTGALVCALAILWNTAFGGLMIQPSSIPAFFRPFKFLSPSFFAYESMMVNELTGQTCLFNPESSASTPGSKGQTGLKVPVSCTEFVLNLGLDPQAFLRDLVCLSGGSVGWILIAIFLMKLVAMLRKNY